MSQLLSMGADPKEPAELVDLQGSVLRCCGLPAVYSCVPLDAGSCDAHDRSAQILDVVT